MVLNRRFVDSSWLTTSAFDDSKIQPANPIGTRLEITSSETRLNGKKIWLADSEIDIEYQSNGVTTVAMKIFVDDLHITKDDYSPIHTAGDAR